MEYVLRNEMELGLKDLFVKANAGAGNFMNWFKGFKQLKEIEKADNVKNLVDDARKNDSQIFSACNAVYSEKDLKVILFEIPEILANGKTFTHAETQKSVEYVDFTSLVCWCATEDITISYTDYQAYLNFSEETDNEDTYWNKHTKYAFKEEEKYQVLEDILNMKWEDIEHHFVSFKEEDLGWDGAERYFLKLDNGMEIVIDKLD